MVKNERAYLVIDGFNLFIRHFMVNEAMNSKSQPIGGLVGFLKAIHNLNEQFSPSKIFVIWESGGGCPRRKRLYPEYKANRAKTKDFQKKKAGTGTIKDLLRLDESAKINQLALLNRLLKTTPICQVFIKDTEADDIIGYLVKEKYARTDVDKIIVSSDKDFYQLLDDPKVKIFDPARKVLVTGNDVQEKYNISARNFCLAKALCGDNSDNIEGIPGVGFKTVAKRFSALADESVDITIDDVLVECQNAIAGKSKIKAYKDIISGESIIRRNWKLMYLNSSTLAGSQIEKVNYTVDEHDPKMDKLSLIKTLYANGINIAFDFDRFSTLMRQHLLYG